MPANKPKKLPNVFFCIVDFDAWKTLSTVSIVAADCVNESVQNADTYAATPEISCLINKFWKLKIIHIFLSIIFGFGQFNLNVCRFVTIFCKTNRLNGNETCLVDMLAIGLHSLPATLTGPFPGVPGGGWNPNGEFWAGRERSNTSAVLKPVLPSKPPCLKTIKNSGKKEIPFAGINCIR